MYVQIMFSDEQLHAGGAGGVSTLLWYCLVTFVGLFASRQLNFFFFSFFCSNLHEYAYARLFFELFWQQNKRKKTAPVIS